MTLIALCLALQDPDVVKVTLDVKNASFRTVLDLLRVQTKVPIEIEAEAKKTIDLDETKMDLSVKDLPLTAALKLILLPEGLKAKVVDKKKVLIVLSKDK